MDAELVKSIIEKRHPKWVANVEGWKRDERRVAGGPDIYDEVTPFHWETREDDSYKDRVAQAVYPELVALATEKFVGLLKQQEPEPDFGALGEVRDKPEGMPTRAELISMDCDGVGSDARTWSSFWFDAFQNAMATGYRWIMVETPPTIAGLTEADEIRMGIRPYLVEYSPIDVVNWRYDRGVLQYAVIQTQYVHEGIEGGRLEVAVKDRYYVLVREGFDGFGDDFAGGGWWMFDEDGYVVVDKGEPMEGTWDNTFGEIPLFRLNYRKDDRKKKASGVTHLGNLAVAFMNVLSWLWHDGYVSGSRKLFFLGVDGEQWKEITDHTLQGGVYVPVPARSAEMGGGTNNVGVYDTGSTSANSGLQELLDRYMSMATQIIMRELTAADTASGVSRRVEFMQGNSPRLATMAENIEESQRIAIYFLQLQWLGSRVEPSGGVTWPKSYDLRTALEKVLQVLEIFQMARANSPTLLSRLIKNAVEGEGLFLTEDDADADQVLDEIRSSLDLMAQGETNVFSALQAVRGRTRLEPEPEPI